ncbi:MAG: TIGR02587 family membrane protein [Cyanobacteria bacterium CRU_2_1]|nr:TIGR02587 family membrane protein [Cyanobacteria bacterium CRU_2_1]
MAKCILPPTRKAWFEEFDDLIRGASGGFLFGIPLLYTMEVWWIGSYTEPPLILGILAVTFVVVFLLNCTDGFRQLSPDPPAKAAMDSVEALALGMICATCILILLREVTGDTPLDEALGKIIFESVPFSLGVAVARSLLSGDRNQAEDSSHSSDQHNHSANQRRPNVTLADIGATSVGAIFVAFNIAPTDEIPMLAATISPPWLLLILFASLHISYCIVFVAGFTTQQKRVQQQGLFQHPITETVIAYLVSLVAAAGMLWFFHRLDVTDPWTLWLQHILILGLPATIGGAAGRLAV